MKPSYLFRDTRFVVRLVVNAYLVLAASVVLATVIAVIASFWTQAPDLMLIIGVVLTTPFTIAASLYVLKRAEYRWMQRNVMHHLLRNRQLVVENLSYFERLERHGPLAAFPPDQLAMVRQVLETSLADFDAMLLPPAKYTREINIPAGVALVSQLKALLQPIEVVTPVFQYYADHLDDLHRQLQTGQLDRNGFDRALAELEKTQKPSVFIARQMEVGTTLDRSIRQWRLQGSSM